MEYDSVKKNGATSGKKRVEEPLCKQQPSRAIVHAKLEMTEPGDHDELEADVVADEIVNDGKVRRKISGGGGSGMVVSPQVESQIAQLQGGGHAMPEGLRNMMESGFGRDFSQVRLHTDAQAAEMSSSISAKAFTHGNDIYFNQGQYSPNTSEGQKLVAHELTHVVQCSGKVGREKDENSSQENGVSEEFDDLLQIINVINDIYSCVSNWKTFKNLYLLKKLLRVLKVVVDTEIGIMRSSRDVVSMGLSRGAEYAGRGTRILGWGGVLLALYDLYSTFKTLDFEEFPISSTSIFMIKTVNFASVLVSHPRILAKVASVSPVAATIAVGFGTGYAAGDLINTTSKKLFGKAPGEAIVDAFMD